MLSGYGSTAIINMFTFTVHGTTLDTVDLVIFACFYFREFIISELFMKSRILELSILMIVVLL